MRRLVAALPSFEDFVSWTGLVLLGAGLFLAVGLGIAMIVIGVLLIIQGILIAAGKQRQGGNAT